MPIPTQMTAGTSELNPPTSTDIPDYTDNPVYATCDENIACPHQEYCFKGQCVLCVSCDIWNRLPAPSINGTSCAKSEAECGFCLPGFQDNNSTRGGQMITCQTIPTSLNSYDEGPFVFNQTYFNIFFVIWLLCLSIWVFCAPKLKKLVRVIYRKLTCKNSNRGNDTMESEPAEADENKTGTNGIPFVLVLSSKNMVEEHYLRGSHSSLASGGESGSHGPRPRGRRGQNNNSDSENSSQTGQSDSVTDTKKKETD